MIRLAVQLYPEEKTQEWLISSILSHPWAPVPLPRASPTVLYVPRCDGPVGEARGRGTGTWRAWSGFIACVLVLQFLPARYGPSWFGPF